MNGGASDQSSRCQKPLTGDEIFAGNGLSKPYPDAVKAFRISAHEMPPLVDPAVSHGLTDAGQAERFADRYRNDFRFDHTRKMWLRWGGQYWVLDTNGEHKRGAMELARDLYLDASYETNLKVREVIAKYSIQQQSRRKIEDVLELAKVIEPISDSGAHWNQEPFLLATPWSVVDLQSGRSRDGRPSDRITYHTSAKYDPLADCPRWIQFLNEVFCESDLIAYVQRAVGYSATSDMREQVLFLCCGEGANGKSTFIDTIGSLLGD